MPNNLGLSLQKPDPGNGRPGVLVPLLLVLLIVIVAANLIMSIAGGRARAPLGGGLTGDEIEGLAIKLENQGLLRAAAGTWKDYVESARPGRTEAARIWYRIGKLYQSDGDCERALQAYYRSESLERVKEISSEISRRSAECLEDMGKFAVLRHELERRTSYSGTDSTAGDDVLVEIGSWKIDRSGLDIMIEAEIDAQISQMAGSLTPEQKRMQKEKLLDEVLKSGNRDKWLERFVVEELLFRRAVEDQMNEDREFLDLTRRIERQILAQRYLDREFASRIKITPEDVRAYYDGHTAEFEQDGQIRPFEEVSDQVYMKIRSIEEMRAQQEILEKLKEEYDVVIHHSHLGR